MAKVDPKASGRRRSPRSRKIDRSVRKLPTPKELVAFCAYAGIELFPQIPADLSASVGNYKKFLARITEQTVDEKLRSALWYWEVAHTRALRVIEDTEIPQKYQADCRLNFRWRRARGKMISRTLAIDAELSWERSIDQGKKISLADALDLLNQLAGNRYKTVGAMLTAFVLFGLSSNLDSISNFAVSEFVRLLKQWERFVKQDANAALKAKKSQIAPL